MSMIPPGSSISLFEPYVHEERLCIACEKRFRFRVRIDGSDSPPLPYVCSQCARFEQAIDLKRVKAVPVLREDGNCTCSLYWLDDTTGEWKPLRLGIDSHIHHMLRHDATGQPVMEHPSPVRNESDAGPVTEEERSHHGGG